MKENKILKLPSVVVFNFLALTIALFWGTFYHQAWGYQAGQVAKECPEDCSDGWHKMENFFGGVECDHGPNGATCKTQCIDTGSYKRNDAGKITSFEYHMPTGTNQLGCCETTEGEKCIKLKDGATSPYEDTDFIESKVPNCKAEGACRCFKCDLSGCRAKFQANFPHCGKSTTEQDGTCDTEKDPNQKMVHLRKRLEMEAPASGCLTKANDGLKNFYFCGSPNHAIANTADCVSDACIVADDADWEYEGGKRQLYKCKQSAPAP